MTLRDISAATIFLAFGLTWAVQAQAPPDPSMPEERADGRLLARLYRWDEVPAARRGAATQPAEPAGLPSQGSFFAVHDVSRKRDLARWELARRRSDLDSKLIFAGHLGDRTLAVLYCVGEYVTIARVVLPTAGADDRPRVYRQFIFPRRNSLLAVTEVIDARFAAIDKALIDDHPTLLMEFLDIDGIRRRVQISYETSPERGGVRSEEPGRWTTTGFVNYLFPNTGPSEHRVPATSGEYE